MRRLLLALLILLLIGTSNPSQAQIELATDAPGPLPPQQSCQLFVVPEGFRVELVAAEPQLADPTAIAFGPRGRIFVCELHGYNLEGYLEMIELNKTGELDKEVRRIDAPKEVIEARPSNSSARSRCWRMPTATAAWIGQPSGPTACRPVTVSWLPATA